ncbi:MAG: EVE domain-containing protein [bacterium]|nr:EVE domain-containing protein [bacterium]
MRQYWLVVGDQKNLLFALANGPIWGIKQYAEGQALWDMVREGDGVLLYATAPVRGIVGCATVTTKFRQTNPLWPNEIKRNEIIYPLRFELELEYCLNPSSWAEGCFRDVYFPYVIRKGFLPLPSVVVHAARKHLHLSPEGEVIELQSISATRPAVESDLEHDETKEIIAKIGRIQGFIADIEYPIDTNRLDVVWRRVQNSVPTYAFEVQIGGDIYHAIAKLKHAYDLWNSHIFLVAGLRQRGKCEELLAGTFHEIHNRLTFVQLGDIKELYSRKVHYKEFERELGILQ